MRRALPWLALLALAGCDQNTTVPPHAHEDVAPSAAAPGAPAMPAGDPALPAGHPALPAGHPALPAGHPAVADMGGGAGAPVDPAHPSAGGVTWQAPAPFQWEHPSSSMRAAEYVVPEQRAGEDPATLAVYYFGQGQGGTVQDNVERWVTQFTPPGGKDPHDVAAVNHQTVHGMAVTTVDTHGDFRGMGMTGAPNAGVKQDQRLLGAIVEGPQGPIFFKLIGQRSVVGRAQGAFDALVGSLRPSQS